MSALPWAERIVLVLLLVASVASFWWRVRSVVEVIRRARPTPDFPLKPLGPRVRQFLWEVVLQGKVVAQRPLPGLAHALVFWGFCAFSLITINHIACLSAASSSGPGGSALSRANPESLLD
jgi:hypothetical protein